MLSNHAYNNPISGVWGTFERERKRLGLQFVDTKFCDSSGLNPDELKAGFYRLRDSLQEESAIIRKARLFEYLLLNGRIAVDPEDWFADKLDHQGLMSQYNKELINDVPEQHISHVKHSIEQAWATGCYEACLDIGHVSAGWRYILGKGLIGLLNESRNARKKHGNALTAEQADFYDGIEIVYNAIISFTTRLSQMAAATVGTCCEASDARLLTIADSLKNLSSNPPGDFHEALQLTYIMHQMIEIEGEMVRSMGGFDRNYISYYEADIENGKLTIENTKEMIKFFFTKFFAHTRGASNGKNFYFGGQLADGANAENELTYVALEAYYEMNTTDPKLSVRFHKNSTERLYRQVAESIRDGRTSFVLVNDEIAIPAIMAQGKTLEEARDYVLIGCYEPAIEGREIACNMCISFNLAKPVELVFNRGIDIATGIRLGPDTGDPTEFTNYAQFENAYFEQFLVMIDRVTEDVRQNDLYWPLINPSPVLAATYIDAVSSGLDIGQGGPKYNNTGCMGAGIATATDSLNAIKKAVFEDRVCTMAEITDAIKNDFVGYEKLRFYLLHRIPRWGNGNPEADAAAIRIVEKYSTHVNKTSNSRGGVFVPSLFSLTHRYSLGKNTSATPDGRAGKEPISLNNVAVTGKDSEGVTALLQSLTSLNYLKLPNGSVSDIYLHPSTVKGEEGLNVLISLIKTYHAMGGFGIQFNIFDKETLIDAQKFPEKYQTLQIRVCGWNVYFVTMSAYEQEQYINANFHAYG